MAELHDALDEDAVWEQLMAELREIEERINYAIAFHKLMNQRSHIDTPVQYERLFLHSPGGKKEKEYDHRTGHRQSNLRRIPHIRF